jgi:putative membrane protein
MISGLREKILSALKSIGIEEGEVFTTDTHSVNALTLNKRGYHPIGEVMDHGRIIRYVNEATQNALANLKRAKVGYRMGAVQNVKVIGRASLEKLCLLPSKAVQKAKRIAVPIFAVAYTLLMSLLFFI